MHTTIPIPNLLGGISQQPPSVREVNKAQNIENAVPSYVEGLIRRPPSEFLTGLPSGTNTFFSVPNNEVPFFHFIDRDETEKYLLTVFNNGKLCVTDLLTKDNRVIYGGDLPVVSAASKRKALTIGDVTYISSADQTVSMTTAVSPSTPADYNKAALVAITQSNYNRKHTIKVTSGGQTYTCSHISRGAELTHPACNTADGVISNISLVWISGTKPKTGTIKVNATIANNVITKVDVIQDADSWENDWLKDAEFSFGNSINGAGSARITFNSRLDGEIGTNFIADVLTSGNNAGYIGHPGGLKGIPNMTSTAFVNSTIYLQSTANFTVVVEDDFGDQGCIFIRDEVQSFEELPPTAPHNYIVKVFLSPESDFDDYYVKFEADNANFSKGLWVETSKPGIKTTLDSATMPKILIRQSDLTFYLKNADGTTPSTNVPVGANYDAYKWGARLVGDDGSNPLPSFVGKKISDISYYQSRLILSSEENIILSEVSEFFNFFRTSVLDYFDSDPIDVASSLSKVGFIASAVPFNRDLILFSPTNQMLFAGPELLAPKTANISAIGDYENLCSFCPPAPSANSIFFPYKNGNFCGIREFVPSPNVDGTYNVVDLTGEVASLIPGIPEKIATTTLENLVAVVSEGALYLYKYFNSGPNRTLSSWFKFNFPDSGRDFSRVLNVLFIDSDMYVVLGRKKSSTHDYITVEKLKMGTKAMSLDFENKPTYIRLDARSYDLKGTYNASTDQTSFKLPAPLNYEANKYVACTNEGEILSIVGGTTLIEGVAGGNATVLVSGNYSSSSLFIGLKYKTVFEFSPIYLRKLGPNGNSFVSVLHGRTQIKYLNIQFESSSFFNTFVRIPDLSEPNTGYSEFVHTYTGENLGISVIGVSNISSGVFKIPVYAKNDKAAIIIESSSPGPFRLLSAEVEIEYNPRNDSNQ